MAIVHVTATFQTKTHIPADFIENTFTFADSSSDATTLANAATGAVESFYVAAHGSFGTIGSYLSPAIDRAVPGVTKAYRLSATSATVVDATAPGVGHGSPILTGTIATPAATTSSQPYPNVVCACLSFHGYEFGLAEHSGHGPRPAERRRGRVYVGPLNTTSWDPDPAQGVPVLHSSFISALAAAGTDLMAAGLVIWSRVNVTVTPVTGGFVDNRFDTQRRRQQPATFRTNWGAAAR